MASEIDELMNLDPMSMTPADIDRLIAYHRKNRGLVEAGVKPKKEEGPKLNLAEVLGKVFADQKAQALPGPSTIKRRG